MRTSRTDQNVIHIQNNQDILVPPWHKENRNPNEVGSPALLCSSQKLNYFWSLQRAKSTLHFSKTTDNCSPNSFAVTLQDVVTLLLQSPQTLAKIFLHQLLHYKTSLLAWGRLQCQRPCWQLWTLPAIRGIFPAQVLTFLFSTLDACSEVNKLLMSHHPLQQFQTLLSLGADYLWLLKFSLQFILGSLS